MAARYYTVAFNSVAVTAQQDFFEISPADDKPVEVLGLMLAQSSDAGDAQDEQLALRVIRGFTASGSGGSAATPTALSPADTAAGFAAEINNTTVANTGTTVDLHNDAFNVRAGYQLWLPEGCEWKVNQAQTTLVVRLATTPADSLTMSGTLYCREL
jgi:hypothetical protein